MGHPVDTDRFASQIGVLKPPHFYSACSLFWLCKFEICESYGCSQAFTSELWKHLNGQRSTAVKSIVTVNAESSNTRYWHVCSVEE